METTSMACHVSSGDIYQKNGWAASLPIKYSDGSKMISQPMKQSSSKSRTSFLGGSLQEALQSMEEEDWKGEPAATNILLSLLQQCIDENDVEAGRELHSLIKKNGFQSDDFLGGHLIQMYTVFDSLPEANVVFCSLPKSTVFPWSAIMAAHVKLGQKGSAFQIFRQLELTTVEPDAHIYGSVVRDCSNNLSLAQGMRVHAHILSRGFDSDVLIGNQLISFYIRCGQPADGYVFLKKLPSRDIVSWNTVIAGHVYTEPEAAIKLFHELQQEGNVKPDKTTLCYILKACSMLVFLEKGREIHSFIVGSGDTGDAEIGSALIVMYGHCGSLQDAQLVFEKLKSQGTEPWDSLIAVYAEHGFAKQAFGILEEMQTVGIITDGATFVRVLNLCFDRPFLERGIRLHAYAAQCGLHHDLFVGNALVNMYAKCGSFHDASIHFERMLCQDVVTYNTVIMACGQHKRSHEAFRVFELMLQEGFTPDRITFVSTLKACSVALSLEQTYYIHARAVGNGLHIDTQVSSALMRACIKCGTLKNAIRIFEGLPKRGVEVWNVLMDAYVQRGDGGFLFHLLGKLREEGLEPNEGTYVLVLKACSMLMALEYGRKVHASVIESGFEANAFVNSTVLDMYINCGSLESGRVAFDRIPNRTVVSWNALLSGFNQHRHYATVLQKFDDMHEAGVIRDEVSILCSLSACSHAGLLDYGCKLFKSMLEDFGVEPAEKHFNCVVDMLGQAGNVPATEDLLETMPFRHNIVGWTSLLKACKMHASVDVGRRCFDKIATMECADATGYVLMSGIYAEAGMWDDVRRLEELRCCLNRWKKPARAYIEVDDAIHTFSVNETRHPRSSEIYAKIKSLSERLGREEEKECEEAERSEREMDGAGCGHSEKLAIAFGLLCTALGTTIRVAKNIRMCADCHSLTKGITVIENREIIVKDTHCIHRFQGGVCSCGG